MIKGKFTMTLKIVSGLPEDELVFSPAMRVKPENIDLACVHPVKWSDVKRNQTSQTRKLFRTGALKFYRLEDLSKEDLISERMRYFVQQGIKLYQACR